MRAQTGLSLELTVQIALYWPGISLVMLISWTILTIRTMILEIGCAAIEWGDGGPIIILKFDCVQMTVRGRLHTAGVGEGMTMMGANSSAYMRMSSRNSEGVPPLVTSRWSLARVQAT
jgi:hypothetical protein